MLRKFSPKLFPSTVIVHGPGEVVSPQGAVSSAPGATKSYAASVQPQGVMPTNRAAGGAEVPTAPWSHNVYIPIDPADQVIPVLALGDQLDILDRRGGTLVTTVQGPAEDLDMEGVVWWLKCLATTQ
jgi:hypothetical protein